LTNSENLSAKWFKDQFGDYVDIPACYKKLLEEVGELGEALMHNNSQEIRVELGDILNALNQIVRTTCPPGVGFEDVLQEAVVRCGYKTYDKQGGKGRNV